MRNLTSIILFVLVSTAISSAQTQDTLIIPEKVMSAFTERFQDTSMVQWKELEKSFSVEFLNLGDPFIAQFSKNGKWLSSKETIMRRQVEDDLIDLAEESYPEYGLERFFNYRNNKNQEFVIFELKQGDSVIYVRQGSDGKMTPLD